MVVEDPPGAGASEIQRQQVEASAGGRRTDKQGRPLEVYNEVLGRLRAAGPAEISPAFEDALWAHFHRLPGPSPVRAGCECVNVCSSFAVVLVTEICITISWINSLMVSRIIDADIDDSFDHDMETVASNHSASRMVHPPPAFVSSSNLEALALETSEGDLTCLLGELALDIQEAHAFPTIDGYSLDVFVVTGWHLGAHAWPVSSSSSPSLEGFQGGESMPSTSMEIPTDSVDVWEIDLKLLKFGNKVASGSNGDLYRGSYCSQDVTIKIVRPERISADMYRDFA
ncbi:hypothetical protein PR202_gb06367 [Eleusine coracana subsp. coracana]|uniref:Uncharacterized protein n=1 Tax=Eleusine coracana subsp. coracana TaxID=191504 RepID=A0AAV5E8P8_ELECO|nr:hypothetical protein PR202_gb06367 [Eleusine coracana subsp. coracana]